MVLYRDDCFGADLEYAHDAHPIDGRSRDIYDPTDWSDAHFISTQRSDHRRLTPQSQQCACALCNPRRHEIHLPVGLFQPRFGSSCNTYSACSSTPKTPRILTDAGFSQNLGVRRSSRSPIPSSSHRVDQSRRHCAPCPV